MLLQLLEVLPRYERSVLINQHTDTDVLKTDYPDAFLGVVFRLQVRAKRTI